jgi:hypothetical protein
MHCRACPAGARAYTRRNNTHQRSETLGRAQARGLPSWQPPRPAHPTGSAGASGTCMPCSLCPSARRTRPGTRPSGAPLNLSTTCLGSVPIRLSLPRAPMLLGPRHLSARACATRLPPRPHSLCTGSLGEAAAQAPHSLHGPARRGCRTGPTQPAKKSHRISHHHKAGRATCALDRPGMPRRAAPRRLCVRAGKGPLWTGALAPLPGLLVSRNALHSSSLSSSLSLRAATPLPCRSAPARQGLAARWRCAPLRPFLVTAHQGEKHTLPLKSMTRPPMHSILPGLRPAPAAAVTARTAPLLAARGGCGAARPGGSSARARPAAR